MNKELKEQAHKEFTKEDAINAEKWWGSGDYPVAYGTFCDDKENTTN